MIVRFVTIVPIVTDYGSCEAIPPHPIPHPARPLVQKSLAEEGTQHLGAGVPRPSCAGRIAPSWTSSWQLYFETAPEFPSLATQNATYNSRPLHVWSVATLSTL